MASSLKLQPLFESYDRFLELNFLELSCEQPSVRDYLRSFPDELGAVRGYLAVRSFLKSYAGNQPTFNSYRTHAERLLLWSLCVAKKPILTLRRKDAETFMEFCLKPPSSWIGSVTKSRFIRSDGCEAQEADLYKANEKWRPFTLVASKRDRKLATELNISAPAAKFKLSQGSVAQIFAVCGSFYQHAIDEGLTEVNPFRAIKQKSNYKQRNMQDASARSLTSLQWKYVIETAEQMANDDPRHERTLFLVATVFSMYLRVSDLVGRDNWQPCMGDIRRDSTGNWWFHVVGKGNKAAKISIREEYIECYLKRYRLHLGLSPLPSLHEKYPLLTTFSGRAGLSDRHIRHLIQEVFDESLERMQEEGFEEDQVDQLRSASLHWLRHTSATLDAPYRDMKDLQADLRHNSLSTTQNIYYNSLDENRANSVKNLRLKPS